MERLAYGGGEGMAIGLLEEQSPVTLIPDYITPGALVLAPILAQLSTDYGRDVAFVVDALSAPCDVCARNTYLGGVCFECEERLDATLRDIAPALELVGTYSPREA